MAAAFLGVIAQAALSSGIAFFLFPELGALACDVFTRPDGRWARAPVSLVLTPSLAGVMGVLVARHMSYGLSAVLVSTLAGIGIVAALRSPVAPAISAGVLPLLLGIRSVWYPVAILIGATLLAVASVLWRRVRPAPASAATKAQRVSACVAELMEARPTGYGWLPFFLGFIVFDMGLVALTGWRTLLVPPLIVAGYEMFAHAPVCPWARRPARLPLACCATAAVGSVSRLWLGTGALSAASIVLAGMAIIAVAGLDMPPAVAIGLLPLLLAHPSACFPVAVGLGSVGLSVTFAVYRRWLRRRGGAGDESLWAGCA